RALCFVVFVITDEWFLDSETFHQDSGVPRVFGCDQIDSFQNLQREQRDVAQIANWRREHVKHRLSSNQNWSCAIDRRQKPGFKQSQPFGTKRIPKGGQDEK